MNKIFLNISNHPSKNWSPEQTKAAHLHGELIVDMKPPLIDPGASAEDIFNLAQEFILSVPENTRCAMISTEYTFTFALVSLLQKNGITCVAATTERTILEDKNGVKTSIFSFIQFREFLSLRN